MADTQTSITNRTFDLAFGGTVKFMNVNPDNPFLAYYIEREGKSIVKWMKIYKFTLYQSELVKAMVLKDSKLIVLFTSSVQWDDEDAIEGF